MLNLQATVTFSWSGQFFSPHVRRSHATLSLCLPSPFQFTLFLLHPGSRDSMALPPFLLFLCSMQPEREARRGRRSPPAPARVGGEGRRLLQRRPLRDPLFSSLFFSFFDANFFYKRFLPIFLECRNFSLEICFSILFFKYFFSSFFPSSQILSTFFNFSLENFPSLLFFSYFF